MADPPSYEESTSLGNQQIHSPPDEKVPQRFSIREEVGVSRSQHVAALVSKLVPQVRNRARQGLSKSTLLLLPSNQDGSRKGQLVGFPQDDLPILIQLEGQYDTIEFWSQQEAQQELRNQLLAAVSNGMPGSKKDEALPERPQLSSTPRSSWFERSQQAKSLNSKATSSLAQALSTVDVQADEAHFRSENDYGLYETLRARCVLVIVDVR